VLWSWRSPFFQVHVLETQPRAHARGPKGPDPLPPVLRFRFEIRVYVCPVLVPAQPSLGVKAG